MEMIPDAWLKFFPGVDIPTMVAIGFIAFILQRADAVSKGWSLLVPLVLGTLVGIAQAIDAGYSIAAYVLLKGTLLNGAAASAAAHGVDLAMQKMWPPPSKEVAAVAKGISDAANTKVAIDAGAVPTVTVKAGEKDAQ